MTTFHAAQATSGLATMLTLAFTASAQPFEIPWSTIDSGGGVSSGGAFTLHGTIGQFDAGELAAGAFTLRGGFWTGAAQPSCYADCDQSTGPRVLDIFDFLCFGNAFARGDPYACDCDLTSGPATCDIFDFLCFGNAFAAGCP